MSAKVSPRCSLGVRNPANLDKATISRHSAVGHASNTARIVSTEMYAIRLGFPDVEVLISLNGLLAMTRFRTAYLKYCFALPVRRLAVLKASLSINLR
jgi:hypothetical protein